MLQVGVGGFWMSAFVRPRGFPVLNLNAEGDVLSVHLKRLPPSSQSSSRASTPCFPGDGVDGAAGPRVQREVRKDGPPGLPAACIWGRLGLIPWSPGAGLRGSLRVSAELGFGHRMVPAPRAGMQLMGVPATVPPEPPAPASSEEPQPSLEGSCGRREGPADACCGTEWDQAQFTRRKSIWKPDCPRRVRALAVVAALTTAVPAASATKWDSAGLWAPSPQGRGHGGCWGSPEACAGLGRGLTAAPGPTGVLGQRKGPRDRAYGGRGPSEPGSDAAIPPQPHGVGVAGVVSGEGGHGAQGGS